MGCKWLVGTGAQINVWKDNWLPTKPSKPAQGPGAITEPSLHVDGLMKPGTEEWDSRKMAALICPQDVTKILQVRPSVAKVSDIFSWNYTDNGVYTVKSGYYIQRQLTKAQNQQANSSLGITDGAKTVCSKLWKERIPPKLKAFWWRIVHNSLPVAEALLKRGLKVDQRCQLCGESDETINHLLFQCRVTKEIWELVSSPTLSMNEVSYNTLIQNIHLWLDYSTHCNQENLFYFVGWRIWKMRNMLIFNNKREHIVHVVNIALMDNQLLEQSLNSCRDLVPRKSPKVQQSVISLEDVLDKCSAYCCFVDASSKSSSRRAGIGWSLYRKEGTHVLKGSSSIAQTSSSLEAEAMSLLKAVQTLKALGYFEVTFAGDCKVLYEALQVGHRGERSKDALNPSIAIVVKDILA